MKHFLAFSNAVFVSFLKYVIHSACEITVSVAFCLSVFQEYGKAEITIINPAQFPDKLSVSEYLEPTVLGTIVTPQEYIGKIIVLCQVGVRF